MAKILIIDDDVNMRRTVSRVLRRGGHKVVEAEDGVEGLQVFRAERPDIVVSDIVMPKKEGIETILELRREHPALLILAISGNLTGSTSYLHFAEVLGANRTLTKPFRAADLLREIDNLVQGSVSAPKCAHDSPTLAK
jgi:DNA-binding response OmpR family regulator